MRDVRITNTLSSCINDLYLHSFVNDFILIIVMWPLVRYKLKAQIEMHIVIMYLEPV